MKATDAFSKIISEHLESIALNDPLFAETLKKPNKNINDCVNYIFTTVEKSGCNGFADEEVFAMAVHYYDEDDVKSGKPVKCKVVVNHTAEAIKKSFASPSENKPAKKIEKKPVLENQTSLF